MTTRELLEAVGEVAAEHAGPLTVDELLDKPVVRCGRCGTVVWRRSA